MNDDLFEEEMQVAKEQDSSGKILSSETFMEPLSNIDMPKALVLEDTHTIKDAIKLMQQKKIGSVVITKKGKLIGIVTERDILMKVIGVLKDWESSPITDIMTPNPEALMADDMIAFVLNNMHVGGYRHVPVIDDDHQPTHIISIKDVVSFILDHFPEEVANITSTPYRGVKSREGA